MRHRLASAEAALGSPVRNLLAILAFMALVTMAAIAAYMAAGWSLADASYMVALTVYTVGYGEVRPIDTPYLHGVTMATMVLGCTGMIVLTGALVQLFTLFQLRQLIGGNRMQQRIEALTGHVIVCGYGRIGVMLADELARGHMPLVVLERSADKLGLAEAAGHAVLAGDATDEAALLAAGIARARVLATVLPDDAANVFITLSARSLAPGIEIIARGEAASTERKLRHAGADRVVLPTHIGAENMARMILFPSGEALGDQAKVAEAARKIGELGLRVERVVVVERSPAAGLTVAEAERRGAGAFFVVQIERPGAPAIVRPDGTERFLPGDHALIVARDAAAAHALLSVHSRVKAGRNTF